MAKNQELKSLIGRIKFIHGLTQAQIADELSVKSTYLSDMVNGRVPFSEKFRENLLGVFPDAVEPTGNTVTVGTAQQSTVVGGNYYGTPTRTHEEAQPIEAEQIPVVPVTIAKQADVDTLDYLRNNMSQVEISSVNVDDMQLTFWLPMPDDNMEPEIRKGDRLGLWAYPDGKANPIPGKIYAVETYSNGFIVRYLFITPEGDYLMRSQNPELFPDFIVRKDDVMRVYKKLIMVRI